MTYVKALMYGLVGAMAGGAIYACVAGLTGYEIGLIGILIGVMVATMIRKATPGGTNVGHRAIAVVLTYLAMCAAYWVAALVQLDAKKVKITDDMMLRLAGRAFYVPFVGGVERLAGIAILGFALYTAWRLTASKPIPAPSPSDTAPGTRPPL